MKQSLAIPLCFAIASYTVTVTAAMLACAVWLSLFTLPPGTEIRPFGEVFITFIFAAGGTFTALGLAITCIILGRKRIVAWILGIFCFFFSFLPLPLAWHFSDWVMQTQGLIPKP